MEQPDESISLEEFAQTEQARANSETWNAIPTVRRRKAPPPPTEAQEPQGLCYVLSEAARKCQVYPVMSRTYQHSSNLAVPWEQKRLAAEARVKELEADLATLRTGIKSVIKNCDRVVFAEEAYKKACADTKKCLQPLLDRTKSTASTENEAEALRTRLERAEEALRAMLAHCNAQVKNCSYSDGTLHRSADGYAYASRELQRFIAAYFLPPSRNEGERS